MSTKKVNHKIRRGKKRQNGSGTYTPPDLGSQIPEEISPIKRENSSGSSESSFGTDDLSNDLSPVSSSRSSQSESRNPNANSPEKTGTVKQKDLENAREKVLQLKRSLRNDLWNFKVENQEWKQLQHSKFCDEGAAANAAGNATLSQSFFRANTTKILEQSEVSSLSMRTTGGGGGRDLDTKIDRLEKIIGE